MKRAVFLFLMPLVATVSIGCGSYASAGAATRPSQFCTAMKPAVLESQRLKPELADMNSHTVAKTKSQLLTEINTILNALRSVKVQLRSAPDNVRSSFKLGCLGCGKGQDSSGARNDEASNPGWVGELVGSHPEEGLFIVYIGSQCEGPATSSVPTTP